MTDSGYEVLEDGDLLVRPPGLVPLSWTEFAATEQSPATAHLLTPVEDEDGVPRLKWVQIL